MFTALRVSAAVLALTLCISPTNAQLNGEWVSGNLSNNCRSLGFEISGNKIGEGLKKRIQEAAELKLRMLGIWSDTLPDHPVRWLQIEVFFGPALFVRTVVYRSTPNTGNGAPGIVIVWETFGIISWPKSDKDLSLDDVVSAHLDSFSLTYLKANPNCRR